MNIFKIEYTWYEGDCGECFLAKDVDRKYFEKDLIEARDFAESLKGIEINRSEYLGKGYSVECLPEFFRQICWFLTEKKGYIECYINDDTPYFIDDDYTNKIGIQQRIEEVKWKHIEYQGEK